MAKRHSASLHAQWSVILLVLACLSWFGIQTGRTVVGTAECDLRDCRGLTERLAVDPACILDPLCISPFFDPTHSGVQAWTGIYGQRVSHGDLWPPALTAIALPNLGIFFVGLLGAAMAAERRRNKGLLGAVYLVGCAEVARWLGTLTWFDGELSPLLVLESGGALLGVLGVVLLARRLGHWSRSPIGGAARRTQPA